MQPSPNPALSHPPQARTPGTAQSTGSLRLLVQQPALPKYRVPVFRELARRSGIHFRLLYGSQPGLPNVEPDGFDADFVPIRQRRVLGNQFYWHDAQLRYATREHADVLMLSWNTHYASLVPAMLRARANGVPVILWGHGQSAKEAFWRRTLREKVGKLASALLFYNRTAARQYIEAGWDARRIFVAPNSLDQTPVQQARRWWLDRPEALAAFRREQGLGDRDPVVLFVSRLEAGRQTELLLDAVAQLRGDCPDLKAVIVGKGPHQQALERHADALGIADRVRFTGAIYDEMQLAPWFLSATAFGFPSYMGLSLLHAFGYGLPVVTSDRVEGHGPEIDALRHGENGLLFADGDATAMANALRTILDDRELARQMSGQALRTATEEFSLGRMVDGFEAAARYCGSQVGINLPGPSPEARAVSLSHEGVDKVGLAIVCNAHAPYRIHLHQRVAREIPRVKLWTVFTHQMAYAPWSFQIPWEIGPVLFGREENVAQQTSLLKTVHEWKKAGRIIRWMRGADIRAVVVLGYNDTGRIRIIRWCRQNGIPCFIWGDSNIRNEHLRGLRRTLKKMIVPRILGWCTGALACGTGGRAFFEKYGVPPDRVFLFPLEPDYDLVGSLPKALIEDARRRWGLVEGRRRIVFSGRLVGLKRVDLLIDAFASIADRRPDWDLVIVGDGPLRQDIARRVPPGLAGRVIWTGFLEDQARISAIYRASDVLVLPSEREAWALVINEAAAASMAIVSSSVPGAAMELVRDGVNGRVFPVNDLAALTDALLEVTDAAHVDRMKAASADVLADWRRRGDPVAGLQQALEFCGVLPSMEPAVSTITS